MGKLGEEVMGRAHLQAHYYSQNQVDLSRQKQLDFEKSIYDAFVAGFMEGYYCPHEAVDKKCSCTPLCRIPCKGTCGCQKCHDDYSDFLSME